MSTSEKLPSVYEHQKNPVEQKRRLEVKYCSVVLVYSADKKMRIHYKGHLALVS